MRFEYDKEALKQKISPLAAVRALLWTAIMLALLSLGRFDASDFVQRYMVGPHGLYQFLLVCGFVILIWLLEMRVFGARKPKREKASNSRRKK